MVLQGKAVTASHVNASLITLAFLGIVAGMRLVTAPLVRVAVPPAVSPVPTASPPEFSGQPVLLGASLVDRDPFRVERRPASVLYDPARVAQPTAPRPPTPLLMLVGMVWDGGRSPSALVDGLPGVDGPRPMRRGETLAGLTLKTMNPDRVVITGFDTTWTLTVREPWR